MAFRSDLDSVILGVLQAGPAHGYEIVRRIRDLGGEEVPASEGQVYPALHRLEKDGCLASAWQPQTDKPAKKTYMLTHRGSTRLGEERQRWRKFRQVVDQIMITEERSDSYRD